MPHHDREGHDYQPLNWFQLWVRSLAERPSIHHLLRKIMSKLDDLNTKVDELQSALDTEQQQIRDAIAALEQTIADLTTQIGTAPTDAQLQAVIDKLDATKTDLEGTIPDAPPA